MNVVRAAPSTYTFVKPWELSGNSYTRRFTYPEAVGVQPALKETMGVIVPADSEAAGISCTTLAATADVPAVPPYVHPETVGVRHPASFDKSRYTPLAAVAMLIVEVYATLKVRLVTAVETVKLGVGVTTTLERLAVKLLLTA